MAVNDASSRDLDKRTKQLSNQSIGKGQGLYEQQLAQNQLQAIQNEMRNNLMTERAVAQQNQSTNQILAQAGELLAAQQAQDSAAQQQMAMQMFNPQTQAILNKYQNGPKVQRTQGRSVQIKPPQITINNNYKTETVNNVGPTQGRPVMFSQPTPRPSGGGGGSDGGVGKFKAWLGGVFNQQKEEAARREREFDRREWSLTKSANKMLRRIESAGKDVIENMNPRVIGTTFRSQIQTLLFIFGVRFLAKHWTKVLDVLVGVSNGIKSALDYLGVTTDGKRLAASGGGFKNDVISFFGGDPRKDKSVFTVFRRLGTELMDYLKKKMDHGAEERAAAIKAIKFPEIDFSNIGSALSGITGYLADILTAMVDPKKGIQSAIASNIKNAGIKSARIATAENGFERLTYKNGVDYGDYSLAATNNGQRSYSLLRGALDNGGALKDNAAAEISQGRDLLGALENAKRYGRIDTSRFVTGFSRFQDNARKTGGVIVDEEFIRRMYASDAKGLMASGDISEVPMKFVILPKGAADYEADEGFLNGAWNSFSNAAIVDKLGGAVGHKGMARFGHAGGEYIQNTRSDIVNGKFNPLTAWYNYGKAGVKTIGGPAGAGIIGGMEGLVKGAMANGRTIKLLPADAELPPGAEVISTKVFYRLTPSAVSKLASRFTGQDRFNSGDIQQTQRLRNILIQNGGGAEAVKARYNAYGKRYHPGSSGGFNHPFANSKHREGAELLNSIAGPSAEDYDLSEDIRTVQSFENLQQLNRDDEAATLGTWNRFGDNISNLGGALVQAGANVINAVRMRGNAKANGTKLMKFFMSNEGLGLTKQQAAALVGVLNAESGLNPARYNVDEFNNRGTAITKFGGYGTGIAQWTGLDRKARVLNWWNNTHPNERYSKIEDMPLEAQAQMLVHELKTERPRTHAMLKSARSVEEAVDVVLRAFENGGDGKLASISFMNKYKGGYAGLTNVRRKFAASAMGLVGEENYQTYTMATDPSQSYSWNAGSGGGGGILDPLTNFMERTPEQITKAKAIETRGNAAKLWNSGVFNNHYKDYKTFSAKFSKLSEAEQKRMMEVGEYGKRARAYVDNQKAFAYRLNEDLGSFFDKDFNAYNMSQQDMAKYAMLVKAGRFEEANQFYLEKNGGTNDNRKALLDSTIATRQKIYHEDQYNTLTSQIKAKEEALKLATDPITKRDLEADIRVLKEQLKAVGSSDISVSSKDKDNILVKDAIERRNVEISKLDVEIAGIRARKVEAKKKYEELMAEAESRGDAGAMDKIADEYIKQLTELNNKEKQLNDTRNKKLEEGKNEVTKAGGIFSKNYHLFKASVSDLSDTFNEILVDFKDLWSKITDGVTSVAKEIGSFFKKTMNWMTFGLLEEKEKKAEEEEKTKIKQGVALNNLAIKSLGSVSGRLFNQSNVQAARKAADAKARAAEERLARGKASGGYLPDGSVLQPAGIVHAGEWVAPQWMVKDARYRHIIQSLENSRVSGRAKMGYGNDDTPAPSGGQPNIAIDPVNAKALEHTNSILQQIANNTTPRRPEPMQQVVKRETR